MRRLRGKIPVLYCVWQPPLRRPRLNGQGVEVVCRLLSRLDCSAETFVQNGMQKGLVSETCNSDFAVRQNPSLPPRFIGDHQPHVLGRLRREAMEQRRVRGDYDV